MKGKPYKCKDCKFFIKEQHNKNDTRGRGKCELEQDDIKKTWSGRTHYYSDPKCTYFYINPNRNSNVYIHYGDTEYRPELILNSGDRGYILQSKMEGLWGSPANSEWGWKQWCEAEDFRECKEEGSFKFRLKSEAEILHIYKEEDILDYVEIPEGVGGMFNTLFGKTTDGRLLRDKLKRDYDAIELHLSQNYAGLRYTIFNSWDCDSIVVWNPDVIIPIYEEQ